jgi:hypothetical protein
MLKYTGTVTQNIQNITGAHMSSSWLLGLS